MAEGVDIRGAPGPGVGKLGDGETAGGTARERRAARPRVGLRIVLVRWHDAWFDFEQPTGGWHEDYLVQTVGYLVRESDTTLSVAQELLPQRDGYRAVTHIPRGTIQSVTTLFQEAGPARRAGDRALQTDA